MIDVTFASPWRAEFRATQRLALPLILTNLSLTLIGATDVVMIGWLGTNELAAASLGSGLIMTAAIFCMGLITATAPMMASERGRQAHSAKDLRRTFRQGLWVSVAISSLVWLVLWQTAPLLRMLGQDDDLAALAGSYVRACMWSILPYLWVLLIRNFLSVLERPGWSLVVGIAGVFVNAGCNYVLMFGGFGLPPLGLVGAGIGSVLANLFMLLAMMAILRMHRRFRRYSLFGRWWRSDWERFRTLWKFGVSIGVAMALEDAIFIVAVVMMGWFGPNALAAHAIALQIGTIAFMVPMGVAQAATVRVGMGFGSRDPELIGRAGWTAFCLTIAFMVCVAVLIATQGDLLVSLFISAETQVDAEVAELAVSFLAIAALIQVVDGIQVVCTGMLRGLHDTRWPMIFAVTGYSVVGIGVGAWLAFARGWQGLGIWVGLGTGISVVALLVLGRWLLRDRLGLLPDKLTNA
ncbi:MATE family efflux transporter [Novosphingobium sp. ERW19]|uniref:MATE family efflux transporter n=1 Tax=Novosphingobium sp. ERW19 TaxID=2726186 RepID=UPI001456313D|nr:MATE family efflux transporter [Novosphingobium sp. ERW19]NLR41590.1 MATE family efflux transporter [Novosphingobium sp. ERW19]